MLSKMDLHISLLTRPYGGSLNANNPPSIDEARLVPIRTMQDNSRRYLLEPTVGYIVSFKENVPEDVLEMNYSVWHYLNQPELINLGAFLWINWQPFMGYLLAGQKMSIEVGARLGTLSWDTFKDEEEINLSDLTSGKE